MIMTILRQILCMVVSMGDVTFHIVENYSHEHKFEDFKTDYMNGMIKNDLLKKYEISQSVWREWIDRMPRKRAYQNPRKSRKTKQIKHKEYHHFRRNYKGHYAVIRRVDGHKYSYGTYPNKETAEMICKRLLECEWDKYIAYDLLQEYGVRNSIRVLSSRLLRRDV